MSDLCDSATSDDSFENLTNSSDSGVAVFSSGQADCSLFNDALAALEEPPACRVRELAGKGIGMVAERRLFPGDLILAEPTMLVMPVAVFDGDREGTDDWLERNINRLGSGQRELLLSLTDSASPADPTYIGRFYTNCMSWGEDVAVFPLMARSNHSCRPNAEFVASLDAGRNELRAMYMIEAGAEVTINYLCMAEEGCAGREERQTYLRRYYGFQCCCRACTLQGDEQAAEELVREELRGLEAVGAALWAPGEVTAFLAGMATIQGKLTHLLVRLETCWIAALTQPLKLEYCMRGLALALSLHGPLSLEVCQWRERADHMQLWARSRLPGHH